MKKEQVIVLLEDFVESIDKHHELLSQPIKLGDTPPESMENFMKRKSEELNKAVESVALTPEEEEEVAQRIAELVKKSKVLGTGEIISS